MIQMISYCSVLLLLVVVFYIYAIIGMEAFAGAVYVGCWLVCLFICHKSLHSEQLHSYSNIIKWRVHSNFNCPLIKIITAIDSLQYYSFTVSEHC